MKDQGIISFNLLPISVLEEMVGAVDKLNDRPHYVYINSGNDNKKEIKNSSVKKTSSTKFAQEVWDKETMTKDVLQIIGQTSNKPHFLYGRNKVVQTDGLGNTNNALLSEVTKLLDTHHYLYTNTESATQYEKKTMLALLISAHNEELVLKNTIQSAINAGCAAEHIYVVDDNSSDSTSKVARSIIPKKT
jgi:hypothetical protein